MYKPFPFLVKCCLCILLFAGALSACKKGFDKYYDGVSPKGGYLYEKLKTNASFSTFARAVERSDVAQYIDKGGLYTVFAPTNEAFAQFLQQYGYASVEAVPVDKLFQIVSFHIVNNMWYQYDLKVRYATYNQRLFLTRTKKFVNIDVTVADSIKVNGIGVVNSLKDIDADNGVIHGLNGVLVPLPNLEELMKTTPAIAGSSFYQLMQVLADSAYDRFNSFDRDKDGRIDSIFYRTYPMLSSVNTSIEFRTNTAPENQGGDPLFNTVLLPVNEEFNKLLAPALAKNGEIKKISPTYAKFILESYFLYDTLKAASAAEVITGTTARSLRAVDGTVVPLLPASLFITKDIAASNGVVHIINDTFSIQERLKSAFGQASIEPDLTIFMAAVEQAGLTGTLAAVSKSAVILAPTNDAFKAVNFDVKKRMLNGVTLTATQFSNLIRNHFINENFLMDTVSVSSITKSPDLGGNYPLRFFGKSTADKTINVITSDSTQGVITWPHVYKGPSNGYIYRVNKVLSPKVF